MSFSAVMASGDKDVAQLPADPRVKTGKLANGLTYYIVQNKGVKGVADFAVRKRLVQCWKIRTKKECARCWSCWLQGEQEASLIQPLHYTLTL